jgi:dTMP kinase
MLLEHKHEGMSSDAELLMMFASRAEHLHKVILPALEAGKNVLCDRFTEATYAYQGGGRGINDKKIAELENWVQGELRPDLTIILDAPVETGRDRAGRRSEPDRIEKEQNDFFDRVRQTYLQLANHYPHRIAVVDASVSLEQVQDQVYHVMKQYGIID